MAVDMKKEGVMVRVSLSFGVGPRLTCSYSVN
jgi:hypothetical protein